MADIFEMEVSGMLIRFEVQRQLASPLHLIPDKRARDNGSLLHDVLRRKCELDLEGPHEDKE